MSTFTFSRQDILYRNFRTWRRKYIRCIGNPHLTLALLLLAFFLYQMSTDDPSTSTFTKTQLNHQPLDSNFRITRSQVASKKHAQAAIILLAPQREAMSLWNVDRFCFLRRAVRSIDQHLNAHFGPYPILILVAQDHEHDPTHQDGPYTQEDRTLVEQWAPHSTIFWHEINMYTQDALEPGVSLEQILAWRRGQYGGQEGRPLGYQSMCRLWSGRLQNMEILDDFELYMRLDDDSLLISDLEFDPFEKVMEENLTYAYRRKAGDHWGIQELWRVAQPHVLEEKFLASNAATRQEFLVGPLDDGEGTSGEFRYNGIQPYNNFHIARVDFWRSQRWKALMKDMDGDHLFFKNRVGDANVHAMALLLMGDQHIAEWGDFPYAHNSNDMGQDWGTKEWKAECDVA